jgi:hypothetical protein
MARRQGSGRALIACVLYSSFANGPAWSQNLPPPSPTVYKCELNGRIEYSDNPCLGAARLEIEPTRGLNKSTGREREGRDVRGERRREAFAEAIRPPTGKDAKQLDALSQRMKLTPNA